MKRLAVIPARGGSKRIPRKNVKPFAGRPMIAHSIAAAKDSGLFDRIVVSTDDAEIAETARRLGAETPFVRPGNLSDDYASTMDVVRHAIGRFVEQGDFPELTCCIYATAPFIRAEDLKRGHALLKESGSDYVFPVTSFPFPIWRAVRRLADGRLEALFPECVPMRSQDLEEAYHDAGQFYWGKSAAFLAATPLFSAAASPLILERKRVQDIDTQEDWESAELIYEALRRAEG
jgi:pseudaminic acid cytidylyltransferase